MYNPIDTTAFITPAVDHWLEREIFQWVHHKGSIRRPIWKKRATKLNKNNNKNQQHKQQQKTTTQNNNNTKTNNKTKQNTHKKQQKLNKKTKNKTKQQQKQLDRDNQIVHSFHSGTSSLLSLFTSTPQSLLF